MQKDSLCEVCGWWHSKVKRTFSTLPLLQVASRNRWRLSISTCIWGNTQASWVNAAEVWQVWLFRNSPAKEIERTPWVRVPQRHGHIPCFKAHSWAGVISCDCIVWSLRLLHLLNQPVLQFFHLHRESFHHCPCTSIVLALHLTNSKGGDNIGRKFTWFLIDAYWNWMTTTTRRRSDFFLLGFKPFVMIQISLMCHIKVKHLCMGIMQDNLYCT